MMSLAQLNRRRFLGSSFGLATAACASSMSRADDLPQVANPRATSGDQRFEPDLENRLTITVGPAQANIVGTTEVAIQAAVDYVEIGEIGDTHRN